MLWKPCATAMGLSEQHYIELHQLESACLSRSWYWAGREGVRMSLINDSVYPHFSTLNQTDFGCAPTSAAGAAAVWLNLESPQRKLKDREQRAPGEDITSQPLFSHFHMRPHGKAVAPRARFRGSSQSGLRGRSCDMVTCSEERDISRQKHWTLTYQLMSHTDTGTFPLLRSLWKNQRRSEVIQHSFNTKTTE